MSTRTKAIVVIVAAVLLATVIMLPRISEAYAKRNSGEPTAFTNSTITSPGQDQKGSITVVASYHNDTSKPLRDMKPQPVFSKQQHENENPKIPTKHRDSADPVVQTTFGDLKSLISVNMPSPLLNFNGIGFPGVACNCAPPDTNGEVGATQY